MSRRTYAIAVLPVMLLVLVACGVSFAHAADITTGRCGAEKGWGPAKVDSSTPAVPLLDAPAVPVAFADVSEPAARWAGIEGATPGPSPLVLVQLRAPRAPPLV